MAEEADGDNEFVHDRIVAFDGESQLFMVRWTGYAAFESTSEPASHLPRKTLSRFFKRKKEEVPPNLLAQCM